MIVEGASEPALLNEAMCAAESRREFPCAGQSRVDHRGHANGHLRLANAAISALGRWREGLLRAQFLSDGVCDLSPFFGVHTG